MAAYLDRIVAAHRDDAARDERPIGALAAEAGASPPTRPFTAALAQPGLAVIAEVKRRSPSRGDLAPHLDPATLAAGYEAAGAACLSVLTDGAFFGGSAADLAAARAACSLPVLRKDFTVSERDVYDARIMGADALLLIVAALDDDELAGLHRLASDVSLDTVVEVHDERELERALAVGPSVIGVNQRDLTTFEVDPDRAARLAPLVPGGVVRVAESGIHGPDDARRLADAGFDALLVGEALVTADDPSSALQALLGSAVPRRGA